MRLGLSGARALRFAALALQTDRRGGRDQHRGAAIISAARTVPALTSSAVKAAFVEAWTIPAIQVKANGDVLERSKRFARQIGTYRRAQWRRLDTARHRERLLPGRSPPQ